jgi:hypothetical protein
VTSLLYSITSELAYDGLGSKMQELPEYALHPRNYFVTRRIGGLVKVYNTRADV